MIDLSKVRPHAEVVGADGGHVGTVDHVVENGIKLTRKDSIDDTHHFVDVGQIASIDSNRVTLSEKADDAITFVEK